MSSTQGKKRIKLCEDVGNTHRVEVREDGGGPTMFLFQPLTRTAFSDAASKGSLCTSASPYPQAPTVQPLSPTSL